MRSITLNTLGDLRREQCRMRAHCSGPNCGRSSVLDLDKLIDKLGEDFAYVGDSTIERALRCRCGHRGG